MVVINNITGKCYEDLNQRQVARLVSVHFVTVGRWKCKHTVKTYHNFTVYLFAVKC